MTSLRVSESVFNRFGYGEGWSSVRAGRIIEGGSLRVLATGYHIPYLTETLCIARLYWPIEVWKLLVVSRPGSTSL